MFVPLWLLIPLGILAACAVCFIVWLVRECILAERSHPG